MYKKAYYTGFAAYVFMLVVAVVFYKERTILPDSAFNIFTILRTNALAIQSNRFGDIYSQLPVLLGARSGISIDNILRLYSVMFAVYYLIMYTVCGALLRRYDFALVILLLSVLFASDTFYFALSPLPQAIALLVVVLAAVSGRQPGEFSYLRLALTGAALTTVVFFHPLILFVIAFCIVFFLLHREHIIDRRLLYGIAVFYIAGVIVKSLFFSVSYEHHSMSGMKNFVTLFPHYLDTYSNHRFLHACLTRYYWIPVLLTGIIIHYVRTRQYLKLLLAAGAVTGYLALVNISYPSAATADFYIENLYLPVSIFLAVPFIFDIWPALQQRQLSLPIWCLMIATGCIRIYVCHVPYSERVKLERSILDKYGDSKVVLGNKDMPPGVLQMLWGTPYEFLLLSEAERGKAASVIIDDDPKKFGWATNRTKELIVNWDVFPYSNLPRNYFHFTDTTTGYKIVE